jgi:hypothetical protein
LKTFTDFWREKKKNRNREHEGKNLPSILIDPTLPSKEETQLPALFLPSDKVIVGRARQRGLYFGIILDVRNHALSLQHFQQICYLLWGLPEQ